jgi:hypothetical protein
MSEIKYYRGDGSTFDTDPINLDGTFPHYHYDDHANEWVVRIRHKKGIYSICGCPGELEAKTICSCIAAILAIGLQGGLTDAFENFNEFIK